MNKKFSTLMAGLLLAGGLFSSANAIDLNQAVDGQFYTLEWATQWNGTAWVDADAGSTGWKMYDQNGKIVTTAQYPDGIEKANTYFVVEKRATANGNIEVRLKNVATGKYLTFENNKEGWFFTASSGIAEEGYGLFTHIDGVRYGLAGIQDGSDWKLSLIKDADVTATKLFMGVDITAVPDVVFPGTTSNDPAIDNGNKKTFEMSIGAQVWNKTKGEWEGFKAYNPLKGNEFDGALKAEFTDGGMMLKNAAGKYIVLTKETWGTLSGELETGSKTLGYKFAALTKKDYDKAKTDNKILAATYQITQPSTVDGEPLEVVALGESGNYELEVAVIDGTAYLTVGTDATPGTADYVASGAETKDNTFIRFGSSNKIDYAIFRDKLLNITCVAEGAKKVANPACGGEDFIPVAQVALNQPEGQWLYQGGATFMNRESGNTVEIAALRKTDKADVYTDGSINYTIVAVGTPGDNKFNGYFGGEYTADQLITKTFNIGTPLVALDDTAYMTLGKDNKITWTKDAAEAIEFRFTQVKESDLAVIKHFTPYVGVDKDGEEVTKEDTLNMYRYNITDLAGNALSYDAVNKRYELKKDGAKINIVLKGKNDESFNILREEADAETAFASKVGDVKYLTTADGAFCGLDKLYGAHNANELTGDVDAYENVQNDLFVITDAISDLYRSVGTTEALDTIKIFRNIDNNYVLYETGCLLEDAKGDAIEGFLGIQNFLDPQYAEKNPAMYADTAAGFGTWRPQFMLAVDAEKVPAGKYCPICGEEDCLHAIPTEGFIDGRYLVNLVDSVNAGRKDCAFQNYSGDTYYRLGFVQAKHVIDSLFITSTGDKIELNNTADKVCSFAFRYVDTKSDAFTIETLYTPATYYTEDDDIPAGKYEGDVKDEAVRGYVKFHNGIPVVTKEEAEAEIFDLEVLENVIPTANEGIATEGVSVVATNGAVIVKGAEGKNVVITNVLGQQVANTVVSSSEATIAAPAGVVVVAVEGEAAVKAIVK